MGQLVAVLLLMQGGLPGQVFCAPPEEYAEPAPLARHSLLLDGCRADGMLVAVGERGHVLLSEDGGTTWLQARVPTRATLTAVFFVDRARGWAVGHDAVILRTLDGGKSWELVHRAPDEERPLLDVWFRDARQGYAIGAYGYFLATEDGGRSWQARKVSEDDFHLNQIMPAKNGALYIAAEAGVLYRSDDGGHDWYELPSPYEGSFFGTLPLEGDSLLAYGLRGHLFRSDDGGSSWVDLDSGSLALLSDALRLDDGTIAVAGLGGTLLVSRDAGHSFEFRQQPDRMGIASLVWHPESGLWALGEGGVRRLPIQDLP